MQNKYGFNYLSTLAMRANPSEKSEMINQLLFGDTFKVIDAQEGWLKIQNSFDQYEGWISENSFKTLSKEHYEALITEKNALVASPYAMISFGQKSFPISCASRIPNWNGIKGSLGGQDILLCAGDVYSKLSFTPNKLISVAKTFLHAPYLWGGKSVFGIDCSAYAQLVYQLFDIHLPRDAYQQANVGETVTFTEITIGDLTFFDRGNRVVHVGIYLGDQQIIHAFDEIRIDSLDQKGIYNLDKKYYTHNLYTIRRLI